MGRECALAPSPCRWPSRHSLLLAAAGRRARRRSSPPSTARRSRRRSSRRRAWQPGQKRADGARRPRLGRLARHEPEQRLDERRQRRPRAAARGRLQRPDLGRARVRPVGRHRRGRLQGLRGPRRQALSTSSPSSPRRSSTAGRPARRHVRRQLRRRHPAGHGRARPAHRRDHADDRLELAAHAPLQGPDGQGRLGRALLVGGRRRAPGTALDPHVTSRLRVSGAAHRQAVAPTTAPSSPRAARAPLVERIRVPTLLVAGHRRHAVHARTRRSATTRSCAATACPTKMLWFCGGHGVCLTSKGPAGRIEADVSRGCSATSAGDRAVDTGARVRVDRRRRASGAPPATTRSPTGRAERRDRLGHARRSPRAAPPPARPISASPAANAVNVPIPRAAARPDVVGEPALDADLHGHRLARRHDVFAQIVDEPRNVVLGNQVTPIPVVLDGQPHTVTRSLEGDRRLDRRRRELHAAADRRQRRSTDQCATPPRCSSPRSG